MYRIFWEGLGGENTAQTPVKQEEKVGNFTISMSSLLVSGKASFRQINQLFSDKEKWIDYMVSI